MIAIKHDARSIYDYLISLKVNLSSLDEYGNSALHHALLVRDSPLSKDLISNEIPIT